MKKEGSTILLSASDLSGHISCPHLTDLNLCSLKGEIKKQYNDNPTLDLLQERGLEFEEKYLQSLKGKGLKIHVAENDAGFLSIDETKTAMQKGFDVIYQANLQMGRWRGRADFLIRVSVPSKLGAWSYEVIDSKLARETRTGTILQLCLYSEMIANIQGVMPEQMHVITPEEELTEHHFCLNDFMAYYRHVKNQLESRVDKAIGPQSYPLTCSHCDICDWWQFCDDRRRKDDHLSLVAGLSTSHVKEINRWDIPTLEKLAEIPLPFPFKPSRGAKETYERLREQARMQLQARKSGKAEYECLELEEDRGLFRLPRPSEGDIFFDFEGDPFAGKKGLEYLFGWVDSDDSAGYQCLWALSPDDEKVSFEKFVDFVMSRWKKYPDMHIYHFTAYETGALKRLMGKYGTRENEVDTMLRACLFIDLHSITKQAIRAGVETYSLKELEKFHGLMRGMPLRDASKHLRSIETFIEKNEIDKIPQAVKEGVAWYNKEDCISTRQLRNWLESIRKKLEKDGHTIARPLPENGEAGVKRSDFLVRIQSLYNQLTTNVSANLDDRTPEQQGKWLLANMLDYYNREDKTTWWEYFRLRESPPDELLEEKSALAHLHFTGSRQQVKKSVVDVYTFPKQESNIGKGDELYVDGGKSFGTVDSIDKEKGTISIKKGPSRKEIHPLSVFQFERFRDEVKQEANVRLATWVAENGIDAPGPYRAGRDLLLRRLPRTVKGAQPKKGNALDTAIDWVHKLDNGVLPIQGPPGSGKSHTAALMILSLVKSGKKVGITAMAHKVISNLMEKVVEMSKKQGVKVRCARKINGQQTPIVGVTDETDNVQLADDLNNNVYNVVGGTAWLWSREDMTESVDVLFVDEAGQLCLADTIAVSQGAKNLVLLGDPQQLKQPQQGSHPDGTELSALEHILAEQQTIHADQGVFLDNTWRMHPKICDFVSELFYESRLKPIEGLEKQALDAKTKFAGSGMMYVPVNHEGNQSHSAEEVKHVKAIVSELLGGNVYFTDRFGKRKVLKAGDIKVIAPYNLQVNELADALPSAVQVGTVDKFQGQEAIVIIFSMASSSPEDAPRGMEFLYSMNRMNVAVSRSKAVFILVASPRLFEPNCNTVQQMRLANVFCKFLEVAKNL